MAVKADQERLHFKNITQAITFSYEWTAIASEIWPPGLLVINWSSSILSDFPFYTEYEDSYQELAIM